MKTLYWVNVIIIISDFLINQYLTITLKMEISSQDNCFWNHLFIKCYTVCVYSNLAEKNIVFFSYRGVRQAGCLEGRVSIVF